MGKDPVKSDREMMDAVLKTGVQEGWTRLTALTIEYVRTTGFGHVTLIQGEWAWIAQRNGQKRKTGTASLLQTATQAVQNEVND